MAKQKKPASPLVDAVLALAAMDSHSDEYRAAAAKVQRVLRESTASNGPIADWLRDQNGLRFSVSTQSTSLPRCQAAELFPFI